MNQRGYTLVELVIVIAIISTLACVTIPRLTQTENNASLLKARLDLISIDGAVTAYAMSKGLDTSDISLSQLTASGLLPSEPRPPAKIAGLSAGEHYYIDSSRARAYVPLSGQGKTILFYSDTDVSR